MHCINNKATALKIENIKTGVWNSKLEFFSTILTETKTIPNYLMSDLSKSKKSILTKFRISSHMLNIERGRYTRPKTARKDRLFNSCNEKHFLLHCPKYGELRK